MKRAIILSAATASIGLLPWLAGCRTEPKVRHEMAHGRFTYPMKCKLCYYEAVRVRRASAKGAQSKTDEIVHKHMCPDCAAEVTTYTQDGEPMIKCAGCAPEGAACHLCRLPGQWDDDYGTPDDYAG